MNPHEALSGAAAKRSQLDADLRDLDLTPVRYQLALQGWTLARILAAETEFLTFLQSIRRDPTQPHAPTANADLYWHEAILITPFYHGICERHFGRYLHHWPFAQRR